MKKARQGLNQRSTRCSKSAHMQFRNTLFYSGLNFSQGLLQIANISITIVQTAGPGAHVSSIQFHRCLQDRSSVKQVKRSEHCLPEDGDWQLEEPLVQYLYTQHSAHLWLLPFLNVCLACSKVQRFKQNGVVQCKARALPLTAPNHVSCALNCSAHLKVKSKALASPASVSAKPQPPLE